MRANISKNVRLFEADPQIVMFKRFVECSGQGLGMSDLEGGILYANDVLCHMLGETDPQAVRRRELFSCYSPETAQRLRKEILPHVRKHGQWVGELALVAKEGKAIPVIENLFLVRDDAGKPLCFATVFTDISQRMCKEQEQHAYHNQLEQLVAQRTWELQESNVLLRAEIAERKEAEAQRTRLAAILESTSDMVAISAPDGRLLYANAPSRRILGAAADEDIQRHNLSDVHPEWALKIVREEGIPGAIANGVWRGETALIASEGIEIPVSQVIIAHRSASGELEYLSTILRDISDRKQAEEALRESEQRLRGIIGAMNQLLWVADADGRSIYHSPQFIEYSGLKETTREERRQLFHPEDQSKFDAVWEGELVPGRTYQWPCRMRRYNGEYHWFLLRGIAIGGFEGKPAQWFGTATDIDDLVQARQALQNSLEILDEAERIGKMGSWKRDMASGEYTWSAGMLRIAGFPEHAKVSFEQMVSRVHPDDAGSLLLKLRTAHEKGEGYTAEYRILLPDGAIRHAVVTAEASLDSEGKPVVLHGTVQDITERKRMEDELIKMQKLDSLGTLAGGLAHDYNNLLASILGNIELVLMDLSRTDPSFNLLMEAETAIKAAQDLTRQIVTFSEGGFPISKITPVRDFLIQAVRLALIGSKTEIVWNIAEDLPEVKIDENQICQAIQNIVMNAREAMPDGGRLFISARSFSLGPENVLSLAEGSYVRMDFRDEGWGISAENLSKIFDPYFTTKRLGHVKGMGLGLSICYSIIKRHQGAITADSQKGIGTTIAIYIPASPA